MAPAAPISTGTGTIRGAAGVITALSAVFLAKRAVLRRSVSVRVCTSNARYSAIARTPSAARSANSAFRSSEVRCITPIWVSRCLTATFARSLATVLASLTGRRSIGSRSLVGRLCRSARRVFGGFVALSQPLFVCLVGAPYIVLKREAAHELPPMRYVELDGKRYAMRDMHQLYKEQKKEQRQKQLQLFEMKEDSRPVTLRTASDRYANPSLVRGGTDRREESLAQPMGTGWLQ